VSDFNIFGVPYTLQKSVVFRNTEYALVITYWNTNLSELEFFLKYVNTWRCRPLIDLAVCSYWPLPAHLFDYCDRVVKCEVDGGHQIGTTMQMNGGVEAVWRDNRTVTHCDADGIIIDERYFLGNISLLEKSDKRILTSMETYIYDVDSMKLKDCPILGRGSITSSQFGSMFVAAKFLFLDLDAHGAFGVGNPKKYFPIRPVGNFESDRYTQFIEAGYTLDDAIILPRVEQADGLDFSLGVLHNANMKGQDRIGNMLRRLGKEYPS
jgi:hypothetical protein